MATPQNPPPTELPALTRPEMIRADFGRRLQTELNARGWNQAELVRRLAPLLGDRLGRDNVSKWVRGKALPRSAQLEALAKVLQVERTNLLPARASTAIDNQNPPLAATEEPDGRVWLRVNQVVDWSVAIKVMELLRSRP